MHKAIYGLLSLMVILIALLIYLYLEIDFLLSKVEFLENELATKTLHYIWLEEIVESLMGESQNDFKKEFDEFIKSREFKPKI